MSERQNIVPLLIYEDIAAAQAFLESHRRLVAAYRVRFSAIQRMLDEQVFRKDISAQVSVYPPS